MTIQVAEKNVYGKTLVYPVCDTAKKFAKLLNIKSFNLQQLRDIKELGYNVFLKELPV